MHLWQWHKNLCDTYHVLWVTPVRDLGRFLVVSLDCHHPRITFFQLLPSLLSPAQSPLFSLDQSPLMAFVSMGHAHSWRSEKEQWGSCKWDSGLREPTALGERQSGIELPAHLVSLLISPYLVFSAFLMIPWLLASKSWILPSSQMVVISHYIQWHWTLSRYKLHSLHMKRRLQKKRSPAAFRKAGCPSPCFRARLGSERGMIW